MANESRYFTNWLKDEVASRWMRIRKLNVFIWNWILSQLQSCPAKVILDTNWKNGRNVGHNVGTYLCGLCNADQYPGKVLLRLDPLANLQGRLYLAAWKKLLQAAGFQHCPANRKRCSSAFLTLQTPSHLSCAVPSVLRPREGLGRSFALASAAS